MWRRAVGAGVRAGRGWSAGQGIASGSAGRSGGSVGIASGSGGSVWQQQQRRATGEEVVHVDTSPPLQQGELSCRAFPPEVLEVLRQPLRDEDVEVKPDGVVYLPEIKYRRMLNAALGPGAWCMVPRGPLHLRSRTAFREYAMYALGRFVAQAVGEQAVRAGMSEATAAEASKSSALVRCCKDLGIASELWDAHYIAAWKARCAVQVFAKHATKQDKSLLWRRRDAPPLAYPWQETGVKEPSGPPPRTPQPPYARGSGSAGGGSGGGGAAPPAAAAGSLPSGRSVALPSEVQLDDAVPVFFKKYAGKTWREAFASAQVEQYLAWAVSSQAKLPQPAKDFAQKALAAYEQHKA